MLTLLQQWDYLPRAELPLNGGSPLLVTNGASEATSIVHSTCTCQLLTMVLPWSTHVQPKLSGLLLKLVVKLQLQILFPSTLF